MRVNKMLICFVAALAILWLGTAGPGSGQEKDKEALAKAAQNPLSNLITVPFQNNFYFNTGPYEKNAYVLNFQPIVPFAIHEDWNLITRTILPIISMPQLVPGGSRESGIGDLEITALLSPAKPGKWIWGLGPIFQFPTASEDELGAEKWSAGPAGVLLRMDGPWVYGFLINNIWSFVGDDDRSDVNQMLLQPFINYNLPHGWYAVSAPIMTSNWEAGSGNRWTVPVGAGLGKILRVGKLPLNLSLQGYYNVEKPDYGPDWDIRLVVQFMFPESIFKSSPSK
jgi:hypothetical protein